MKKNLNPLYSLKEASSYLSQQKQENKLKLQQQARKSPIKSINANTVEKSIQTISSQQLQKM
jgi:hypothetical protein